MLSSDGKKVVCNGQGCSENIPNNRWSKTRATGWYFGKKDDVAFCPKHTPGWVGEWRKMRLS